MKYETLNQEIAMSWFDVRHEYMEQDDPEAAAEPIGSLTDISPDTSVTEVSGEMSPETTPDVTRCAWCCRELPPDPSGNLYPTCDLCRATNNPYAG